MRIAVADNCSRKFSNDIIEYWINKGHEVKYEPGASEYLAQWADLYFVDWADNNIHYLRDLYHGDPRGCRTPDWDNSKKPIFVCRAIDWDVWLGKARDQNLVSWVDKWICIAPHIEKKLRSESSYRENQLQLIRPGLDLSKWPLKTNNTDGFQVGMVLGDMWVYKNNIGGLNIFALLAKKDPRWKLHIRGQHEAGEYNPVFFSHFIESRGLQDRVILYPHVDNMNQWYEQIDYLLMPCLKEAYSYATAEAMSKGIKPVLNNWYGCEDIWPKEYIFNDYEEAIHMFYGKFEPEKYRQFMVDNYSIERMMKEYDEFLET